MAVSQPRSFFISTMVSLVMPSGLIYGFTVPAGSSGSRCASLHVGREVSTTIFSIEGGVTARTGSSLLTRSSSARMRASRAFPE